MFESPYYDRLSLNRFCDDCHVEGGDRKWTKGYLVPASVTRRYVLSFVVVAGLISVTFASLFAYQSPWTSIIPIRSDQIGHCGNTPEEARARGCRFELHNFAWVPAACYDNELADAWDAEEGWLFSADENGTDLIPKEVALRGDLSAAWVPWSQHLAHCALIWRKFHRAVAFGRPMDSWTSSYSHTSHCASNLVRKDLDGSVFNSLLHLKFPDCDYRWRSPMTPAEFQTSLKDAAAIHERLKSEHPTMQESVPGEHHLSHS